MTVSAKLDATPVPAGARAVGVGLIGLGTIGGGVVRVLSKNASVIAQRLGFALELRRVADHHPENAARYKALSGVPFDTTPDALLEDPAVDIVVELVGGVDGARALVLRAFENGKHVVTANKALLALHGAELFDAARAHGVDVAFEASVGGGIPILRSLREGLAANRIESLHGIMNGTTNYVLSEMERSGEDFTLALERAQQLGYAEADPRFDVDGVDAAHKLTLLVAMAFGVQVRCADIPTEGIRGLLPLDFEAAREFGLRIKLLGIARPFDGGERIEARVHPTMIPADSLLANVDGAMNAVAVQGDAVGPTLFYGAGAGALPTASAVIADLMEIARELRPGRRAAKNSDAPDAAHNGAGNGGSRVAPLSYQPGHLEARSIVPLAELSGRFYLAFGVADRPGVLAQLTALLAEHGVSIESVLQRGRGADPVPLQVLTHVCSEAQVRAALADIAQMPELTTPTRLIRLEEGLRA